MPACGRTPVAEGLANLMVQWEDDSSTLRHDCEELRDATGLEDRESA